MEDDDKKLEELPEQDDETKDFLETVDRLTGSKKTEAQKISIEDFLEDQLRKLPSSKATVLRAQKHLLLSQLRSRGWKTRESLALEERQQIDGLFRENWDQFEKDFRAKHHRLPKSLEEVQDFLRSEGQEDLADLMTQPRYTSLVHRHWSGIQIRRSLEQHAGFDQSMEAFLPSVGAKDLRDMASFELAFSRAFPDFELGESERQKLSGALKLQQAEFVREQQRRWDNVQRELGVGKTFALKLDEDFRKKPFWERESFVSDFEKRPREVNERFEEINRHKAFIRETLPDLADPSLREKWEEIEQDFEFKDLRGEEALSTLKTLENATREFFIRVKDKEATAKAEAFSAKYQIGRLDFPDEFLEGEKVSLSEFQRDLDSQLIFPESILARVAEDFETRSEELFEIYEAQYELEHLRTEELENEDNEEEAQDQEPEEEIIEEAEAEVENEVKEIIEDNENNEEEDIDEIESEEETVEEEGQDREPIEEASGDETEVEEDEDENETEEASDETGEEIQQEVEEEVEEILEEFEEEVLESESETEDEGESEEIIKEEEQETSEETIEETQEEEDEEVEEVLEEMSEEEDQDQEQVEDEEVPEEPSEEDAETEEENIEPKDKDEIIEPEETVTEIEEIDPEELDEEVEDEEIIEEDEGAFEDENEEGDEVIEEEISETDQEVEEVLEETEEDQDEEAGENEEESEEEKEKVVEMGNEDEEDENVEEESEVKSEEGEEVLEESMSEEETETAEEENKDDEVIEEDEDEEEIVEEDEEEPPQLPLEGEEIILGESEEEEVDEINEDDEGNEDNEEDEEVPEEDMEEPELEVQETDREELEEEVEEILEEAVEEAVTQEPEETAEEEPVAKAPEPEELMREVKRIFKQKSEEEGVSEKEQRSVQDWLSDFREKMRAQQVFEGGGRDMGLNENVMEERVEVSLNRLDYSQLLIKLKSMALLSEKDYQLWFQILHEVFLSLEMVSLREILSRFERYIAVLDPQVRVARAIEERKLLDRPENAENILAGLIWEWHQSGEASYVSISLVAGHLMVRMRNRVVKIRVEQKAK